LHLDNSDICFWISRHFARDGELCLNNLATCVWLTVKWRFLFTYCQHNFAEKRGRTKVFVSSQLLMQFKWILT